MLLQRANSSPQLLQPPQARRSMSISQSSTPPSSSPSSPSSSSLSSPQSSFKRRSLSISPLFTDLQKSKLSNNNSRPQTPTSPSSPQSLNSPKSVSGVSFSTPSVKSNVVSERRGSLHMDLDKLDEWLQPDEVLRPTLSILSPKATPKQPTSPTMPQRERSNSFTRFENSNLERLCTSPTFSSPKNASPLNRVLQQEGAATTPKGRNRSLSSMSNVSASSAFSDLSYRSSLSNLSIQYLEPEDDDFEEEDSESEHLSYHSTSNSNAEEQKLSSSESSDEDEDEVIQSAKTFDQLFHKKFSKLPSSNKQSPLDSLLKTTIDEEASTNFVAFKEMLKTKLQEGKKVVSAQKKTEQEILKKKGVKSLSWLKSLIDKLYTYSHDLFNSKGNNIQQQLYTTPMIIYSIMKTKFVYSTVTNMNWRDMLKSAKAYRKHDFEVETFYKFMSGEYTLETFIWFVCSRSVANKAVEELDKKLDDSASISETETVAETSTTVTPSRSVVSDILEKKRRKLQALERKEENRHNLEKSKSFITMQNAIQAVCNLVSKKLIQSLPFLGSNSVNDKAIDPYTLKHNVENVLIRKFGLIRSKELRNEEAISLPQFLGYVVSIKATKLDIVFHELKKYLVDEDHGMLDNFSETSSSPSSSVKSKPLRPRADSGINITSVLEKLTDIAHRIEDGESVDSPRESRREKREPFVESTPVVMKEIIESSPSIEISPSRTPPSLEKSLSNLNLSDVSNFISNYKHNTPIIEPPELEEEIDDFKLPKDEEDIEASLSNEVVKMITMLSSLLEDMPRDEEGVSSISEVFVPHVEHILSCLPTLGKVQEQYATVLLEELLYNARDVFNGLPFYSKHAIGMLVKINQWLASETRQEITPPIIETPEIVIDGSPTEKEENNDSEAIPLRSTFEDQLTMNKLKDVIEDENAASELMDLLSEVRNL